MSWSQIFPGQNFNSLHWPKPSFICKSCENIWLETWINHKSEPQKWEKSRRLSVLLPLLFSSKNSFRIFQRYAKKCGQIAMCFFYSRTTRLIGGGEPDSTVFSDPPTAFRHLFAITIRTRREFASSKISGLLITETMAPPGKKCSTLQPTSCMCGKRRRESRGIASFSSMAAGGWSETFPCIADSIQTSRRQKI